ncbi:MAG: cysteine hydrolase [Bdellovibrionales bacterium]|nr:cysteine hydrolase [Bdellovibrionales bacterium]
MSQSVLLVIDMLKDYFEEGELKKHKNSLVEEINDLVKRARERSVNIVWVRQEFEPDLRDAFLVMKDKGIKKTIKGTLGSQVLDELDKQSQDIEVVKKRYSAFFQTKLDEILKQMEASELIITGINTHACIRMAAIDAYQRDYRVIIPRECVYSRDKVHHDISLQYLSRGISQVVFSKDINFT